MVLATAGSETVIQRITEVDEAVFSSRYHSSCQAFSKCDDACCNYGCQVDLTERDRILRYATATLERQIANPSSGWFKAELVQDSDFPSGWYTRVLTYGGKCVFHDPAGRGCLLENDALERGIDHHLVKPMVCTLFPLTWEGGRLFVSGFSRELPCKGEDTTLFRAFRNEIRFYFGRMFVSELDRLAATSVGAWKIRS
ncbi:MAG: hypothetical protein HYX87_04875 [Chloroflexi bacterium]|nr:hypothetical protein [Chloroflexota bacterium]